MNSLTYGNLSVSLISYTNIGSSQKRTKALVLSLYCSEEEARQHVKEMIEENPSQDFDSFWRVAM